MSVQHHAARPYPAVITLAVHARSVSRKATAGRLSPRLRKTIVAAHVLVAVGWFGVVLAKLVLEVVALSTRNQEAARAGYLFVAALDGAAFPPAAIATVVTGVVLSVGTAWGLFRHWWIVVKLLLTVAVVVTGAAFVGAWTQQAIALAGMSTPAAGDMAVAAALGTTSRWLIGAAVVHVLMLGAATVISVLKPWGQIRPEHRAVVRGRGQAEIA